MSKRIQRLTVTGSSNSKRDDRVWAPMTLVVKTPLRISSSRIEGLIRVTRRGNDGDSLTRRTGKNKKQR